MLERNDCWDNVTSIEFLYPTRLLFVLLKDGFFQYDMAKEHVHLQFVKHLWDDEEVAGLHGLDRLVYRSNKLSADPALTNTGGGNTSSKLTEQDPLTGESVEVLWIKGSGGDLRTAARDGFASLYLDKVRAMKGLYLAASERGPKTPVEDRMH